MNRNRRCRILINGNDSLLRRLAEDIEANHSVAVIDEPNEGVVMVRMRDTARKAPFYLGEVLVTEAKVQVDGSLGIGILKGHHPEKAYQLALVDAAYNGLIGNIDEWNTLLHEEEEIIKRQMEIEEGRIMRTKVDFSTMEDQGVEIKNDT